MTTENGKRRGRFELNEDFPRLLTLLRKERGYSQKRLPPIWVFPRRCSPITKREFGSAVWIL